MALSELSTNPLVKTVSTEQITGGEHLCPPPMDRGAHHRITAGTDERSLPTNQSVIRTPRFHLSTLAPRDYRGGMDEQNAVRRGRRGRPRQDQLAARRSAMIDAAAQVLVEDGYAKFTVNAVTQRAGTSKSTVYSWFGNREGLLQAVVNRHYDQSSQWLQPHPDGPRETLTRFAVALIGALQDDLAVAITRAAMSEPELRAIQLAGGAGRILPLIADSLRQSALAGHLHLDDPATAAKAFFGLVVQDDQVRWLLGERRLPPAAARIRAEFAVDAFFRIYAH